jgi:hypothetical protein
MNRNANKQALIAIRDGACAFLICLVQEEPGERLSNRSNVCDFSYPIG